MSLVSGVDSKECSVRIAVGEFFCVFSRIRQIATIIVKPIPRLSNYNHEHSQTMNMVREYK